MDSAVSGRGDVYRHGAGVGWGDSHGPGWLISARRRLVSTAKNLSPFRRKAPRNAGGAGHLPVLLRGGGSCGQCCYRCSMGATPCCLEEGHFTRSEARRRLAPVLPGGGQAGHGHQGAGRRFGVQRWECTVESNECGHLHQRTTKLPEGRTSFPRRKLLTTGPPADYEQDIDVQPEFREDWDKFKIWRYLEGDRADDPCLLHGELPEEKVCGCTFGWLRRPRATTSPPGKCLLRCL